jgi:hypothetical protein
LGSKDYFRIAGHPPGTVQSAKYVAREMSLNAFLLDVVQFKGHRFEVYGDTLSLSKKVDPQIAIEPFAFGPLLGLKNMGRELMQYSQTRARLAAAICQSGRHSRIEADYN